MEKLTFLGIGPKIARITIPYLLGGIALTIFFPRIFTFGKEMEEPFLIAGIVLLAIALVFYVATIRLMVTGIRNNQLITHGVYRLCRNPLYSALLLFLIPGLGLLLNSWIIPTASIIGCILFRKYIHEEEELLERIFGEEYRQYRDKTSLFFPNLFAKKV
jgi:protein-S-isoprenylcysteine O-methyltransferase Ste14